MYYCLLIEKCFHFVYAFIVIIVVVIFLVIVLCFFCTSAFILATLQHYNKWRWHQCPYHSPAFPACRQETNAVTC